MSGRRRPWSQRRDDVGFEGEHLEWLQFEYVLRSGAQRDRGTASILGPCTTRREGLRCTVGQFECPGDVDRDRLRLVARIAERKNTATRRPRGVAVHVELSRIAADP